MTHPKEFAAHRVIHKHRIVTAYETIKTRSGAKVVLVDLQDGEITLWLMIDTASAPTEWTVLTIGTGHAIPDGIEHLGSVVAPPFVWHLFRER